ncbi:MAG TPA: SDR family NAD(P)-dependent oxidoreductase [Steroidobacteraceae bacterium]|nr:SDR family NAD(P)-dependent oxidoreductase [Steroidobacteraceae bacterium]
MNEPAVLIMGALTGIGRAAALAFAKDGARPVISGRREAEGKALEAELRRLGAGAAFIQADVRRDDEVSNLLDKTVARFGRLQLRRGADYHRRHGRRCHVRHLVPRVSAN